MISYAPDGASVGAHIDDYDVFLLQASGSRRWSIDTHQQADHALQEDAELRLLANFNPNQTYDLQPGDMLYLPPGVPHHGVAVGDDCTTWSIGFRAPSQADVVAEFAAMLSDKLSDRLNDQLNDQLSNKSSDRSGEKPTNKRFRDPPLLSATSGGHSSTSNTGEVTAESIAVLGELWNDATALTHAQLVEMAGCLLTQSPGLVVEGLAVDELDVAGSHANDSSGTSPHPFCRFAYVAAGHRAQLFADGHVFDCSVEFAQVVCVTRAGDELQFADLKEDDKAVLQALVTSGYLVSTSLSRDS